MKKLLPVLSHVLLFSAFISWSTTVPGQGAQSAGSAGNNDALLLLLEQNRNLQSEMQALRAAVEEQGFEIRKLQRESLDRYTDIDSRLSSIEQSGAGGVATTTQNQTPIRQLDRGVPAQTASVTRINDTGNLTNPDPFQPVNNNTPSASLARTTPSRPTLEPAVLSEQQLYQMAYDSAINSQFERAIAEFDQYMSIFPSGRFTANAHYWKGQSYRYLSQYDQAIMSYNIILQDYDDSAKALDALYGLGEAYAGMGNTQRARQLFQEIIAEHPNTGAANLAETRLLSLD